jgi:leader peptidase (prepilin peptidase)/N-methyltransferase
MANPEPVVTSGAPLLPASLSTGGLGLATLVFAAGACIGSFLNVCIHRLPADESVVRPGSRCPGCGTAIAWHDNVPLLSWVWLRARCRTCRAPISARYPLVEAATGALAVVALARFGPTALGLVAFAFTAALLLVTFIDLDHRFIPDEVSLPGILVGLGASFLPDGIGPLAAAAGAALGGGVLWAVAWGYERATGVEGMGLGDVKLLAMIGAFLGWTAIPAVLVIASVTGALVGAAVMVRRGFGRSGRRVARRLGARALVPFLQRAARRTAIPFGPFLALGAVVALYGPPLPGLWLP